MKNKQQGLALLPVIIIVLVLLGGGAYFYSQKSATPAPVTTTTPPGFIPPTTPPPSVPVPPVTNPDLTADWKTYTNEKYGFEFKYPAYLGWVGDEGLNEYKGVDDVAGFGLAPSGGTDRATDPMLPRTTISLVITPIDKASIETLVSRYVSGGRTQAVIQVETVIIGGLPATRYFARNPQSDADRFVYTFIQKGTNVFRFYVGHSGRPPTQQQVNDYYKILSTFRFTK